MPQVVAVDTEATGLTPYGTLQRWGYAPARPFAVSMCWLNGKTQYWRWPVNGKTREVQYDAHPQYRKEIQAILGDPTIRKVWFNIAYDLRMLSHAGFTVRGPVDDTQIMMHVLTGGNELRYALKPLAKKYLGYSDDDETALQDATIKARHDAKKRGWALAVKEHMGREPIKADYWMAPPAICERYAIGDVERTILLYHLAVRELRAAPSLLSVYRREMRLFRTIYGMENVGTRVFHKDNQNLITFYTRYMDSQLRVTERAGGKGLNFRSPKQMHRVFYDERGYAPKINENGNRRLNSTDLLELATLHHDELANAILEYKAADHTVRSFLHVYERFRVEEQPGVWVLHPNFRQCGPVTGRMSCSDPNLMTVASADTGRRQAKIPYRQREVFGPRDGHVWYLPDYSQIEVWLFACLSKDQDMLRTLTSGHDAHGEISRQVWGNQPDYAENHKYYRKRGKLVVFCKLYGGGVKKVASLLECSVDEAAKFVHQFDSRYPGAKLFMNRMVSRAEREGKIFNPYGRVYFIDPGFSYKAVNYLIQGTAADVLKNSLIRLDDLFQKRWKGVRLLLPLHDEIVIEVPRKYHSKQLMREIMTTMQQDSKLVGMPVPLPVAMKIATKRWSDTTDIIL